MFNILLVLLFIGINGEAQWVSPLYSAMEISYVALNVLDYGLTAWALKNGAREMNPLIKGMSMEGMALFKTALTVGVLICNRYIYSLDERWATGLIICATVFYTALVTHNIVVAIKLRKK